MTETRIFLPLGGSSNPTWADPDTIRRMVPPSLPSLDPVTTAKFVTESDVEQRTDVYLVLSMPNGPFIGLKGRGVKKSGGKKGSGDSKVEIKYRSLTDDGLERWTKLKTKIEGGIENTPAIAEWMENSGVSMLVESASHLRALDTSALPLYAVSKSRRIAAIGSGIGEETDVTVTAIKSGKSQRFRSWAIEGAPTADLLLCDQFWSVLANETTLEKSALEDDECSERAPSAARIFHGSYPKFLANFHAMSVGGK